MKFNFPGMGPKERIQNAQERNRDHLRFRDFLEGNDKLGRSVGVMTERDFQRVNEIALRHESVVTEEEARELAMVDFIINHLRDQGMNSFAIINNMGEDLCGLASTLVPEKDKDNDELLERMVFSSLQEGSEHGDFIDKLFTKAQERKRITAPEPVKGSVDASGVVSVDVPEGK